ASRALVATTAPYRVSLATAVFLGIFVASVLALPRLPGWSILVFLLMIPVFYKIQAWSHKIWTAAEDMTAFNRRFPPGRTLRLILLFYEIPICLNYLIYERKDWRAPARSRAGRPRQRRCSPTRGRAGHSFITRAADLHEDASADEPPRQAGGRA